MSPGVDRRLLVLFAGVVSAILIVRSGSGDRSAAGPAPKGCLRAWNSDKEAIAFSRHNAIAHNYNEAQVGYMRADGESTTVSDDPGSGECVVVFARTSLDPEAVAAGQIQRDGQWVPLSGLIDVNQLAEMQSDAFDGANAEPTMEGKLLALGPAR